MRLWMLWFAVAALVVSSAGCRRRYDPVHHAGRVDRYERNLVEIAARDSGCSPVQVQLVRAAETLWVANTCTGPREYFLDCRSRGRRWASCRWDRIATVSEAAAPVLSCPPQGIAQAPGPGPVTRVAQGCGLSVQMSLRCNSVGCGWLADGPPLGALPPGPRVIVIPAQ